MRILIATGIYPPEIGGPAEYAKNLEDIWRGQGHDVSVRVFSKFMKFPWGVRHVLFFFYVLPKVISSDVIFTFEAFSSGLVTIAAKIFNKKVIFRTGGDLLWESYVERTGETVLLRDFYNTKKVENFSVKEKIIFSLMKWTLKNISGIIWSTEYQKEIFMGPYGLDKQRHFVVENYYGPKSNLEVSSNKSFIASSRNLKLKNLDVLKDIFSESDLTNKGFVLDVNPVPHAEYIKKIKESYAVLVVSVSEISPNSVIDAIQEGKPFIVTKEVGIFERIKDVAIFVDPKNKDEIKQKILWLCDPNNYEAQKNKLKSFNFVHSWEDIAEEYLSVYNSII